MPSATICRAAGAQMRVAVCTVCEPREIEITRAHARGVDRPAIVLAATQSGAELDVNLVDASRSGRQSIRDLGKACQA